MAACLVSLAQSPKPDPNKVPTHLLNRCTQELRLAQIEKFRGDPKSEEAVLKALRYLKKMQNKDGSWSENKQVGMTGLALLCFLGHGETAQSDEFGVNVLNAILYLVDTCKKNRGKIASDFSDNHWVYEHAIATNALVEAWDLGSKGFDEEFPDLEKAAMVATEILIKNQHESGGWDYGYATDSSRGGDTSIASWHLQAISAADYGQLPVKNLKKSVTMAIDFFDRCQNSNGSIGYSSTHLHGDGTTLTSAGALMFQRFKTANNSHQGRACRFIAKHMKFDWDTPDCDLYGHYHASQALRNVSGQTWLNYQKMVFPQILANQEDDGSFKIFNGGNKLNAVAPLFQADPPISRLYRTCLCTLILESYYRHPWIPSKI